MTSVFFAQVVAAFLLAMALLAAGIYWIRGPRRAQAMQPRPEVPAPEARLDPLQPLFEKAEAAGEPPTEDDIAQARLGGTRGARELRDAPMVPQQAENTPWPIDRGHVT
jgi:hypothetical protein